MPFGLFPFGERDRLAAVLLGAAPMTVGLVVAVAGTASALVMAVVVVFPGVAPQLVPIRAVLMMSAHVVHVRRVVARRTIGTLQYGYVK